MQSSSSPTVIQSSSGQPVSRNRNKRQRSSTNTNTPRLWSGDVPDYDQFSPTEYICRICNQEIKTELLAPAKTWWERQLILMALVFSDKKTKEVAKREYQALTNNYRRGFVMEAQDGLFFICRDHLPYVGKRWLDLLCIHSPENVMDANETVVREAMEMMYYFNDKDKKFKNEKAFLEHCDQFISNKWHEICLLFPEHDDGTHRIPDEPTGSGFQIEANEEVVENEDMEDEEDVAGDEIFDELEDSPDIRPMVTEGECNICEEHVTAGLVLTTDWNRRILLFMAYKRKILRKERCRRLFQQKDRLLTCVEHAKEGVEEIFEIFGTREQSNFLTNYRDWHFTMIINKCFEDICRVYELWYESRLEWIREVRVFVLTVANGDGDNVAHHAAPSTSAEPTSSTSSKGMSTRSKSIKYSKAQKHSIRSSEPSTSSAKPAEPCSSSSYQSFGSAGMSDSDEEDSEKVASTSSRNTRRWNR